MIRFIGRDIQGVKRVWGEGETEEQARAECVRARDEYVMRRPDCSPMRIERAPDSELGFYP